MEIGKLPEGERRLAAIMFTDMVGYTALTQSNEALAMEVLERHNKLLRSLFPRFHGREVKAVGDSFLVEFESALDALNCAVEVQSHLHDYNLSSREDWKIGLRIGVHLGDVIHREGDVFGDAVNIASRIEPLASPEGVVISEQVYDQVQNKFELHLVPLGEKTLKNVTKPVGVYKVEMPWERGTEPAGPLDKRRVAVLPLVNMIADPSEQYFADGMTEELISAISKVPKLSVISRTSVMGYKNQTKRAGEIGDELNVGTLLEGSVRKSGNRVRIAVQLIDTNTDEHLWAENYDRSLEDVFAIQSEIAQSVASTLKIHLLERDVAKLNRVPTRDPVAHEFFMKGRSLMKREGSEGDAKIALEYFGKAIKQDPNYADPYRWTAEVYWRLAGHEILPSREALPKVMEFANKALELDNVSAESHLTKALALGAGTDFQGWRREVKRAVELNPNLAKARGMWALQYLVTCDFEAARSETQKFLELDPLSAGTIIEAATYFLYGGNPDKALELYQKVDSMDPGNPFVVENTGLCYVRKGMCDQGVSKIKEGLALRAKDTNATPNDLADLPYALASAGRMEEAREAVLNIAKYYEETGRGTLAVARGYAAIGEKDKAFEWLERALPEHSFVLIWSRVDFNLEGMHSDHRFQTFVRKLGLVPEPDS